MHFTIHQSIAIHFIKIEAISNSSVFQIGSTGSVQAQSDIHNTGGYIEPAEPAEPIGEPAIIRLKQPEH
ncbi:hypothetical protein GCM10008983_13760 [Lentibacillus halophilus]|uniref:Spore germination protein PB n=1 Tax=Lentibacillus halophilus TaxID=295065 RepID=A0ABN0Z807_9BACI